MQEALDGGERAEGWPDESGETGLPATAGMSGSSGE